LLREVLHRSLADELVLGTAEWNRHWSHWMYRRILYRNNIPHWMYGTI
jgi:hypothetical protein